MIDTCGDCGCSSERCECGPRWMREALDASWQSGRSFTELSGKLSKELIERLPLDSMRAAAQRALAGTGGIMGDDHVPAGYALLVVTAIVTAIVKALAGGDTEVVTLTELYQNATRALDEVGVPYAENTSEVYRPLDLSGRIRWLAAQRPTRLELASAVADADAAARRSTAAVRDRLSRLLETECSLSQSTLAAQLRAEAERDLVRAMLTDIERTLAEVTKERDSARGSFAKLAEREADRVSGVAARDADAALIVELRANLRRVEDERESFRADAILARAIADVLGKRDATIKGLEVEVSSRDAQISVLRTKFDHENARREACDARIAELVDENENQAAQISDLESALDDVGAAQ